MMKLLGFQVTDFRSVEDSGWIEAHEVTALIGTNESGKTNLLLPLWKLNPARDGQIRPIEDYPRKRYSEFRALDEKPVFIRARFSVPSSLRRRLARITEHDESALGEVEIERDFDGNYSIGFPGVEIDSVDVSQVVAQITQVRDGLEAHDSADDDESKTVARLVKALEGAERALDDEEGELTTGLAQKVAKAVARVSKKAVSSLGDLGAPYAALRESVNQHVDRIGRPEPGQLDAVVDLVLKNMPKFVYYSNYGNLDSEIYLPHVIENLARIETLGSHEAAKARTLRVLFEFVDLSPKEILELGQETATQPVPPNQKAPRPKDEAIALDAERKREREVLLHSAESRLTRDFREWWRQGDYTFRFQADGNHFRIWVADDRRPEQIELESRSTGLQWFLSFFLTFLVESEEAHAGAILLLDEPGLTLHPIAQEDLSDFFKELSKTNEIVYTTHSPFMVDANHLDRVRSVYVDEQGYTKSSPDLRAREGSPDQSRSVYAVDAALGLTVSRTLLSGCQPVVVEGASDQLYLVAIKNYLIGHGLLAPTRDLLFFPAGGVRGISKLVTVVSGADEERPIVLLDSDNEGEAKAQQLRANLYNDCPDRVLLVEEFTKLSSSEIEDLWPQEFLAERIAKYLRGPEEEFDEVVAKGKPVVPQVKAYAEKHSIKLESPGWKVEVAKSAKRRLEARPGTIAPDSSVVQAWKALFEKIVTVPEK